MGGAGEGEPGAAGSPSPASSRRRPHQRPRWSDCGLPRFRPLPGQGWSKRDLQKTAWKTNEAPLQTDEAWSNLARPECAAMSPSAVCLLLQWLWSLVRRQAISCVRPPRKFEFGGVRTQALRQKCPSGWRPSSGYRTCRGLSRSTFPLSTRKAPERQHEGLPEHPSHGASRVFGSASEGASESNRMPPMRGPAGGKMFDQLRVTLLERGLGGNRWIADGSTFPPF